MRLALILAFLALPSVAAPAVAAAKGAAKRAPDLADVAAGRYAGAVVADARGSSGVQVVVAVTRVSKNMVELTCDYARVPTVRIPLQRAMDVILAARGHNNFLIEQAKDKRRLDLSIDGVTMILHKR